MGILSKLFGTKKTTKLLRARLVMSLEHTDDQRNDVAAAVQSFLKANHEHIPDDPEVRFVCGGSTISVTILVNDSHAATALNTDLQQRIAGAGIDWK